jgi:lipopolysaccharide heptosyltransferase I
MRWSLRPPFISAPFVQFLRSTLFSQPLAVVQTGLFRGKFLQLAARRLALGLTVAPIFPKPSSWWLASFGRQGGEQGHRFAVFKDRSPDRLIPLFCSRPSYVIKGPMSSLRTRDFERILLIKPSALGDVIHTLPVLAKLRARYPSARIDWLLTPAIAELVRHHPDLSNVVSFPRQEFARLGRSWSATATLIRLVAGLRRAHYDLVIDLHGQFRSALLTVASAARVRIGFDRPRQKVRRVSRPLVAEAYRHGWMGAREGAWVVYSHRIPIPTLDVHAVDRYLWLGPMLGLDERPPEFHVPIPAEAEGRMAGLLDQHGLGGKPLAVLVPGTVWQTKHWRREGFEEVGRHLLATGRDVVVVGAAKEQALCQALAAACPGACDLCGRTTLSDLAALIKRSAICITNDSGAMHLSVALGKPVVSIFGPTDPVWVGPYRRPEAVVRAQVSCAPCYLRRLRHCRHDHACMNQVTAAMVIERVEGTLAA